MICSFCSGHLEPLGVLGMHEHFRCRNCGMDASFDAIVPPVPTPAAGDKVLLLRGRSKGRVFEVVKVLEDQVIEVSLFGVTAQFKRDEYELV